LTSPPLPPSSLCSAETILNLLSLIEQEGQDFDFVNTAHSLHRLAKLWRSYSSIHAHTQDSAYQQLVLPALHLLSRHMDSHMAYFEPWDVAISIWAYGHLGHQDPVVLPRLLQRAGELSPLFKPADCTQALIGLARLDLREELLLKELSYVLLNQLEEVRAQDLSQVGAGAKPSGYGCGRMGGGGRGGMGEGGMDALSAAAGWAWDAAQRLLLAGAPRAGRPLAQAAALQRLQPAACQRSCGRRAAGRPPPPTPPCPRPHSSPSSARRTPTGLCLPRR
jgi:hypothetical protein